MNYIILFLGCYMFITIMLTGISSITDSKFIQNLTLTFWYASPFIFILANLIMTHLL